MLKDQGDGPHPNKISPQNCEHHQQSMSDYHKVIPYHYNPSEDKANINNPDKFHFIKLKTSLTRVTM